MFGGGDDGKVVVVVMVVMMLVCVLSFSVVFRAKLKLLILGPVSSVLRLLPLYLLILVAFFAFICLILGSFDVLAVSFFNYF